MENKLSNKEILDFLMTSDFEGDYSPSELKYLLFKWKYFYRLLYGKFESEKNKYESKIKKLEKDLEKEKKDLINSKKENSKLVDNIQSLKNRNLTFKERVVGKIIYKK